ncbi:hypothetical protein HX900_32535 [Rhizobium sp. WYCCWR 11290]|uniref:Rap1a immunity protein domain-containing protein n=1 Tax=Rhizobium changzhiense TaxID=2692317 RepID=A0A7Z0UHC3_9HYPH|nr:Rap1a/Tai family immunity protein [Rhizobium changzhiense]NZD65810.1 hypothetical protein [Rhizobium changzhiense]
MAILLLVCIASAQAQQPDIWRMNSQQLLEALRGDAAPEVTNPEHRRQISYERGAAYVAGVADATDGKTWCMEGGVLIHELTDRVFTHLQTLAPEALQQNAAISVSAALSKSFPCKEK